MKKFLKEKIHLIGLSQIVTEGTRVSNGQPVFRYYSSNEEEIRKKLAELDKQIDSALAESENTGFPNDIANLEKEIKKELDNLYKQNDIGLINEYTKKINTYIIKKAEIAGENSPAGSYIKQLIDTRKELNNQRAKDSETITAPNAGLISYRVDGLEELLGYNNGDFSYITTSLLDSFELKVGSTVVENKEAGKIINNYECFIACPMDTENSEVAEVGDSVKLKLPEGKIVSAEIVKINEEGKQRVLIFKITENVESLLEYRKISVDVVWWSFSGWKVSNTAIIEKDDLTYVRRIKAGTEEEILVKVLRQNDTYSIVENYTDEELLNLGFSVEEAQSLPEIKLYDEIKVFK